MIVGFTGSRQGMTEKQSNRLEFLLWDFLPMQGQAPDPARHMTEAHHGDCQGADAEFDRLIAEITSETGDAVRVVVHPPDEGRLRAYCDGDVILPALPYLERNRAIVNACDLLIATPRSASEERRSGTWATIRYAERCHKPIRIVTLDGTILNRGAKGWEDER